MRRLLTLLMVLMLGILTARAQSRTITGRVVSEQGTPVANASIVVKGTTIGTTSDDSGYYRVNANQGSVLQISALNFRAQEVAVGNSSNLIIHLAGTIGSLDEVVVTAGGIRASRKQQGTASTLIKATTLTAGKAVTVAGGLQGKVAGLQINATGGGVNPSYRLILRGQRSLTGNNQALIVLDNVIVPTEVLGNLNPEDIDEINILNGPGAAALYGSQASNGALIITTKKGSSGLTQVRVAQTSTIESVAFFPKLQHEFGQGGTAYGIDANHSPLYSPLENQSYGPRYDGSRVPIGSPLEDGSQDSTTYSYNTGHDDFWVNGLTNQTDFSVQNGDDKSTMYISGQYASVTGTTPDDKFNRTVFRINGTRRIAGNKLLLTYSTNYTQNRYNVTTQTAAMYQNLLNMPTDINVTKYANWRTDKFANPNGYYNPWYLNPYFSKDNYRERDRNDYLIGNIELRFTPFKGLDIVARQGISTRNFSNKATQGAFNYTTYAENTEASGKSDITGSVSDESDYSTELLSDVFIQYTKKVGDFNVSLVAGGQSRQDQAKYEYMSASGLVVPDLYNVSNGVGTPTVREADYKTRLLGAYGLLQVGFKNFLFLHATARNDWDSRLDESNRSFFYPEADLSFVASDAIEAIKESKTISYLKLRGGVSKVGQVNLGNAVGSIADYGAYLLLPTFSSNSSGFPYGGLAGYSVGNNLVQSGLKPEITKQYEIGFDLNLFRNKFTSSVTWFDGKTDDQTVNTSVSTTTGFFNLLTNAGETYSRGLEVNAHVTPLNSRNWSLTVGGNYSYLDNGVNFLSAALPKLQLSSSGTAYSYAVPGHAFPVIMGYDYDRDAQGHVIVNSKTGLPSMSDTISILGNATPKNRVSFDFSVSYKNFHLSGLFEYRGGYKVYNGIGTELDWSGTGLRTVAYDRQPFVFPNSVIEDPGKPGTYITNTSAVIANGNGNNGFWSDNINRDVTSNYVTSGDFWKLRELVLSYDLPVSLLSRTKFIKGATISLQGRNLFVWLPKDNLYTDPEYSVAGSSNGGNGVGINGLGDTPPSRYYGATISVRF